MCALGRARLWSGSLATQTDEARDSTLLNASDDVTGLGERGRVPVLGTRGNGYGAGG